MSEARKKATTAKLDNDRPLIGKAISALLGTLALIGFAAGYEALVEIARTGGMSPFASMLIPVAIDGGMVFFGVAAVVERTRGESTTMLWFMAGLLVTVSVAAQLTHSYLNATVTGWPMLVAAAVACMPPIITFAAADGWLNVTASRPLTKAERAARKAAEQVPEPSSAPVPVRVNRAPERSTPAVHGAGERSRGGSAPAKANGAPERGTKDGAPRRGITDDQLAQAVTLLNQPGASVRGVARELGVSATTLTARLKAA